MAHINVPPTRSNLLRMKKELQFAREGYEILDRKRIVLTSELIRVAHDAEAVQNEVWALLAKAYASVEQARLTMGADNVEWAALAVNKTVEVELKLRGVMGVALPQVESKSSLGEMMTYGLGDTPATLDEASGAFREVMNRIPQLAELVTAVWRLAGELRKTQRRVKALQYIFIPEYEETVLFIKAALDEREREETFRLKWLKDKMVNEAEEEAKLLKKEAAAV